MDRHHHQRPGGHELAQPQIASYIATSIRGVALQDTLRMEETETNLQHVYVQHPCPLQSQTCLRHLHRDAREEEKTRTNLE